MRKKVLYVNKKGLSRPVLRAAIHSVRVGVGVATTTCTFKFEEGKTRRLGRVQTRNEEKHVVLSWRTGVCCHGYPCYIAIFLISLFFI